MLIYGWAGGLSITEASIFSLHDFDSWDRLAPLRGSCDMLCVFALLAGLQAHLLQLSLQEILSHVFESVGLLQELSCLEHVVARVLSSEEGQ